MNKERITKAALDLANEIGLINVTKSAVCERAGMPVGSFRREMDDTSFAELIESLYNGDLTDPEGEVIRARANPVLRKNQILTSAIALALTNGHDYRSITREMVADAAQVSPTLVTRYFSSMALLQAEIMETAICKDIPRIIAQGLANGDSIAVTACQALKTRASQYILNS